MLVLGFLSYESKILIVPGLAFWKVTALVIVICFELIFNEQVIICASVPASPIQAIEFDAREISFGIVMTIFMFCS